jgi:hypothetical protein
MVGRRHNRTCRTRQIDRSKSNIRGYDSQIQERARAKYHDQAGLCKRKGVCDYTLVARLHSLGCMFLTHSLDLQMRKRGLSTTGKLPLIPLRQRG